MSIDEILKARGKTYGDYENACEFRQNVIRQMNDLHREQHGGEKIPAIIRIMIGDIVHKLARIAVTPCHIDSFKDIQGYVQLIINHIKESKSK